MLLPGILASGITGNLSTNNFTSIATATVTSGGASSITFSSIPQTYTHLQLRYVASESAGNNTLIRFNSDTGSNYSWHDLYSNGAGSVHSEGYANQTFILNDIQSSSFTGSIVEILDYTNTTKAKTTRTLGGYDANGSGVIWTSSGTWYNNTAGVYPAINSINISIGTSYAQYSQFALYGVK